MIYIIDEEEWVPCIYNLRYDVSSTGRVWDNRRSTFVKASSDRAGYYRVKIYMGDNERKTVSLHRLVMLSFYGMKHDNFEVNHIDGDKSYNVLENLEFVTRSQNMAHAYANSLSDVPCRTPVYCVETDTVFRSVSEAARAYGISCHKSILRVLNDPDLTCRGFHFETWR